jgi:exo-1,4-beta-D-glucosaminidase
MDLNMLRWESKIFSEHIIEEADRQGIPIMLGWMLQPMGEMEPVGYRG